MMLSVPLIMEKLYKNQIYLKFRSSMLKKLVYRTPVTRKIIHHIAGKKLYKTFGGRLKFFGIGGAKLDYYVERFLKEAKFPYAIGYGLTETAPLLAGAAPHQTKLQSTGYALEGVELRINEPDELGVGEIWAKGPNVMLEYYKNPEATAEVIDKDGWLHSGDLGIKNEQGNYVITGRIKDMIIRGGENIYPREIEEFLYHLEGVKDVQVAAIASQKYGEEVGAFIIQKEGVTLTEEIVKDFCRGKIARHKIPKYVFFIDGFPLTGSGKIQKYKLKDIGLQLLKEQGITPQ